MTGAIAVNFHEGSRSEYLAQYVFASFGAAVPVPQREDSGVDLYCTLTERVGQLAWPVAHFTVQVKSILAPWVFEGEESVHWLVKHPLPMFLCFVDKSSARIRVYHTSPRFYLWSMPPLPQRLELVPATETYGRHTQWKGGDERFSLSAPILDFSIQDMFEDGFHANTKQVLKDWIDFEQENLYRIKTGILTFTMPYEYQANKIGTGGLVTQGTRKATTENIQEAVNHLKELLGWVTAQFHESGDFPAAVRGALLLRHLSGDDTSRHGLNLDRFFRDLNERLDCEGKYLYAGIDELNNMIAERLTRTTEHG